MERLAEWSIMFFAQLAVIILLGSALIGVFAACHHHIAYWAAYVIIGVIVFFGEFFMDNDWIT